MMRLRRWTLLFSASATLAMMSCSRMEKTSSPLPEEAEVVATPTAPAGGCLLPDGSTVEIIALGEDAAGVVSWWRPDGVPIDQAPVPDSWLLWKDTAPESFRSFFVVFEYDAGREISYADLRSALVTGPASACQLVFPGRVEMPDHVGRLFTGMAWLQVRRTKDEMVLYYKPDDAPELKFQHVSLHPGSVTTTQCEVLVPPEPSPEPEPTLEPPPEPLQPEPTPDVRVTDPDTFI